MHAFAVMPNGDLVAGGSFTTIGGVTAAGVARRSGSLWQPLGSGISGTVLALVVMPNGDLIAGGRFSRVGGVPMNHIARWDGTSWSALGAGVSGGVGGVSPVAVHALLVEPNGDLLVGGHFFNAGGVPANHIARWDGNAWSALGGGLPAGGYLSPVPVANALVILPNGDVVAAGNSVFPGSAHQHFARWNGAAWLPMGVLPGAWGTSLPAEDMLALPNGDLIACGSVNLAFGISAPVVARWNGATWSPLGAIWGTGVYGIAANVIAMTVLPDGDLLVGGRNVVPGGGSMTNPLLRWDGVSWTSVGGGQQGDARALVMLPSGGVAVGGDFTAVGGIASPAFAELVSPCMATVAPAGTGCSGSAGSNTLNATTLPWLGSTFRSVANGLPPNSVSVAVASLSPATMPLSLVLPIGGAGCDGLVAIGRADLLFPSGGPVAVELPLPDNANLFGVSVYQYVATLEFNAAGTPTALTATNRLVLSLGVF